MRYFLFILWVFFSSIVFGQSGFNPPKINEPLKVENVGIDTVRVLDSVRVYFQNDTLNSGALSNILDTLSDQNTILKDYFLKQESDCIGSNETYYINGTNTITLSASEVCSYTIVVLEGDIDFTENGVPSPFPLNVGYSGSNSFKGGAKFLINQVSFTGLTGGSRAIIKVIK